MKTKLKLVISTLLVGLFINAGHAKQPLSGSISTKFTSEVFDRGQAVSYEALQGAVSLNSNIGRINTFGTFSTSQSSNASGADLDESTLGAGTSFSDGLINASVGIYNSNHSALGSGLEAFVKANINSPLSPTITVFKNTDEELYTYELGASHSIATELVDVTLSGLIGNTDLSSSVDSTYTNISIKASKDVQENLTLYTDVSLSDSDTRSTATLLGIGLALSF